MTTLQVLRKRSKSIRATADMASAMKTASSVKYARIARILNGIEAYSTACEHALSLFGDAVLPRKTTAVKTRNAMVLLSNDRGFCGGFNSELLKFFGKCLEEEEESPLLMVNGQKGITFCKERGLDFEELELPEIPSYGDAEKLTEKLFELYNEGEVSSVKLVFQRFANMMTQVPSAETILPPAPAESGETADMLFLPDRETALQAPAMYCLVNSVYHILLEHSAGIQAATTIAMRNACDNAEKSLEEMEMLINRIRQAEVTNSVIETSSFLAGNFES